MVYFIFICYTHAATEFILWVVVNAILMLLQDYICTVKTFIFYCTVLPLSIALTEVCCGKCHVSPEYAKHIDVANTM